MNRLAASTFYAYPKDPSGILYDMTTYGESVTYNANSAPTQVQRYGKNSLGNSGLIDNLTFTYSMGHPQTIYDAGSSPLTLGSTDFRDNVSGNYNTEYAFDSCGSMKYDTNKGISSIRYDYDARPLRIQFHNGSLTENVYTPDGTKLRTTHRTAVEGLNVTPGQTLDLNSSNTLSTDVTQYIGNFVFKGSQPWRVLFDGGFVDIDTVIPRTRYYVHDHLGSVRAVVSSSGTSLQSNHYYPTGVLMAKSTSQGLQPFKYNGKEFDNIHALNQYDYGARWYDPAMYLFTSMDPMCEKYYHISPYAYCGGNPVNYVDPDGRNPIFNRKGKFLGVDDWGLKGDALFFDMEEKDFDFKYSHEDALKMNLGMQSLLNEDAKELYLNTYNNLPNRPDWDGYITLSEANNWYRNGNGQPLFADLSQINLSGIFSLGEKFVGQEKTFNLLLGNSLSLNDGLVFGGITLKRYPNHTVRAYNDDYNFEMHPWSNPMNWIRNVQTIIGGFVARNGTPYKIYPYGSQKLTPIFPWLK